MRQLQSGERRFCVVSGLLATVCLTLVGGTLALADPPTSRPHPPAEATISEIHDMFSEISTAVGGLTKDEQAREDALEKTLAAKVKAKPDVEPDEVELLLAFRGILSDAHKPKFDKMLANQKAEAQKALSGSNLQRIYAMATIYANANGGTMPPSLGSLVAGDAKVFLAGDSKTPVPPKFESMDIAKQADWVNAHSDFAYLAGGKPMAKVDDKFVVAYSKAAGPRVFLLGDGTVRKPDEKQSDKIVAELTAGKNPPPSLPK